MRDPAASSTAPSHGTQDSVCPSKHSLQNDGQTHQTPPHRPLPSHPPAFSPPAFLTPPTIFWALAVSLRKAPDSRRARSWEKWRLSTRKLPEYTWLTVTSALYPGQKGMGYQRSMSGGLLPLDLSLQPSACPQGLVSPSIAAPYPHPPGYTGIPKVHAKHPLCWAVWKQEEG